MTNRQLTLLKYSLEDFTSSRITTRRPMAVVEPVRLKDQELREAIERLVPSKNSCGRIIQYQNVARGLTRVVVAVFLSDGNGKIEISSFSSFTDSLKLICQASSVGKPRAAGMSDRLVKKATNYTARELSGCLGDQKRRTRKKWSAMLIDSFQRSHHQSLNSCQRCCSRKGTAKGDKAHTNRGAGLAVVCFVRAARPCSDAKEPGVPDIMC
ncbi:hypothetical protein PGTUg99_009234 [Puccinia graminis f. sp. tritici]|uniref:Uncharacterized protein n=1 Tax=Puccinia graminis f. sp. tritici TaxID=56615 RepID=A0A5B0S1H8_PUCGR|nr:hypothetical protein PGTUg99_009234 [Puccinia graminis f. sp. tritici]